MDLLNPKNSWCAVPPSLDRIIIIIVIINKHTIFNAVVNTSTDWRLKIVIFCVVFALAAMIIKFAADF